MESRKYDDSDEVQQSIPSTLTSNILPPTSLDMQVGNIFPMGMPKGPWNSFEEAQHSLNIWSTALVTVPFKIIRGTQRNESRGSGVFVAKCTIVFKARK